MLKSNPLLTTTQKRGLCDYFLLYTHFNDLTAPMQPARILLSVICLILHIS